MGPSEGQLSAENVNVAAWPVAGIGGRQLRSDSDQIACRMWCDFEVAVVDVGMALRLLLSSPKYRRQMVHRKMIEQDGDCSARLAIDHQSEFRVSLRLAMGCEQRRCA